MRLKLISGDPSKAQALKKFPKNVVLILPLLVMFSSISPHYNVDHPKLKPVVTLNAEDAEFAAPDVEVAPNDFVVVPPANIEARPPAAGERLSLPQKRGYDTA